MRSTLTLAAAVAINLVALAVLSWSVDPSQSLPRGEVTVTQLSE
jgi:hypothetical protein